MKKAQAANEAAVIIGLMTMFLIIFIAVMADQLLVAIDKRAAVVAEDLSETINSEIVIASKSEEGYTRTFEIPPTIRGKDYNITLYNATATQLIPQLGLIINLSEGNQHSIVKVLPENVSGVIQKGAVHCINKSQTNVTVRVIDSNPSGLDPQDITYRNDCKIKV